MKKEIPEIKKAYAEYRHQRSEERKSLNKLQKIIKNFSFIDTILKPRENKQDDKDLEWAVLHLFESIGFKGIKPESNADVDARVKFKKIEFGIEAKNGDLVGENDMFQALKYKNRTKENYHPILVYNNAKTNQDFDNNRKTDAENNAFTIITTRDLIKGYLKLKNNKITFEQFVSRLQIPGLVTFTKKDIGRSINSVATR